MLGRNSKLEARNNDRLGKALISKRPCVWFHSPLIRAFEFVSDFGEFEFLVCSAKPTPLQPRAIPCPQCFAVAMRAGQFSILYPRSALTVSWWV